MTNLRFRQVFEDMFKQVELNCTMDNKKKMDIIWKMIKNYLYSNRKLDAVTMFNLLINMFKDYCDYGHSDKYIEKLKLYLHGLLIVKAQEYMASDDRLHNFNLASEKTTVPADLICIMFMIKHLVSIDDIVNERIKLSQDKVNEKFYDAINYCILLKAIQEEK